MQRFFEPFSPFIYYDTQSKVSNNDEIYDWIIKTWKKSPVNDGNFYNTGFTTYYYDDVTSHLDTLDIFKPLAEIITDRAAFYVGSKLDHLMANGARDIIGKRVKITHCWFNVNPRHGYQGRHHHSPHLLAGTYYVDVPQDSGDISFYDPNPWAYYSNQSRSNPNLVMPNYTFSPHCGDLLIWPGWMDHEIGSNKNEENKNRITVSFCIDWTD